jgi:AcrR family transcriptional regulator
VPRWKNNLLSQDDVYRMKREAVLREAGRAFSKKGYHNTSLDEVAKTLNVTKAALYNYVRDKQEILFECHKLALDLGDRAVEHALARGTTGLEKLRLFMTQYIELITGELGSCAVLIEVDALRPQDRQRIVARRDDFQRRFVKMIKEGIADGTVAPIEPKLAVFTFMGAINWMPRWYSPEGRFSGTEIAEHVTNLLLDGMAAGRQEPARRAAPAAPRRGSRSRAGTEA